MAKVKVIFPSMLIGVTAGEREAEVSASTLGDAIAKLIARYGEAFKDKVLDSSGKPRRLLNIYINGRNVRFMKQLETLLKDGDEVSILPSVSGG